MPDILDGLANASSQPSASFDQKRKAKIAVIRQTTKQFILEIINKRQQLFNAFWNDANLSPMAIVAGMEPGEAFSLFARDAAMAQFLAGQLATAGMASDQIAKVIPGVPDQYVVTYDVEAQTVNIAPRTE